MQTLSGVHRPQQQGTPPIGGPGNVSQQIQQQQPENMQQQAQQQVGPASAQQGNHTPDKDKIYQWIIELSSATTRENALLELR